MVFRGHHVAACVFGHRDFGHFLREGSAGSDVCSDREGVFSDVECELGFEGWPSKSLSVKVAVMSLPAHFEVDYGLSVVVDVFDRCGQAHWGHPYFAGYFSAVGPDSVTHFHDAHGLASSL
jgi:hypothetical protein